MTAANRLIVALDGDDISNMERLVWNLTGHAGVNFFKIGVATLTHRRGLHLIDDILRYGCELFLDLKIYDTADTVTNTVKRAFDIGARFVTVHATPSVMEAAMRAKPAGERCKVLAVPWLSDQPYVTQQLVETQKALKGPCNGIVCNRMILPALRAPTGGYRKEAKNKIVVVPGIRPPPIREPDWHNHVTVTSPSEALRSGADFLVVGRPIWRADDPVEAARAILREMEEVI